MEKLMARLVGILLLLGLVYSAFQPQAAATWAGRGEGQTKIFLPFMANPYLEAVFAYDAIVSFDDFDMDIFVTDRYGVRSVNLTNHEALDMDPQWSPDGSKIAFISNRDGFANLYVMNPDGSGLRNLTAPLATNNDLPVWSPDGTRLAFLSWRGDGYDLFLVNVDGSGLQQVYPVSGGRSLAWSPVGAPIAFVHDLSLPPDPGTWDIFTIHPDGSGLANLTANQQPGASSSHPAWRSDGQKIAYLQCPPSPEINCDIHTMDWNGANKAKLTDSTLRHGEGPRWSPEGSRLVYPEMLPNGYGWMAVIHADGSPDRRFHAWNPGPVKPQWSPDGRSVAYVARYGTDRDNNLYVFDLDRIGASPMRITHDEHIVRSVSWRPQLEHELQQGFSGDGLPGP